MISQQKKTACSSSLCVDDQAHLFAVDIDTLATMAIIHQGPLALKSKGMIGHNYVRHHFKLVQEEEAVVLEWSKSAGGARVGAVRVTANALVACRAFKDAKANYMMIFPAGPTAAEKVVTACADSAADMEAWKQAIEGSSDGVTAGWSLRKRRFRATEYLQHRCRPCLPASSIAARARPQLLTE